MVKVTKEQLKATVYTGFYTLTLLSLGFAALSLRGNIKLQEWAQYSIGTALAVIALTMLITIVYTANKKEK